MKSGRGCLLTPTFNGLDKEKIRINAERLMYYYPYNPGRVIWRAIEGSLIQSIQFAPPILDCGCGDGCFSSLIFNEMDVGIDISKKEITNAKKLIVHHSLISSDATRLPFKDKVFNSIICNSTIEHIPEFERSILEMHRVLKKNGKLVITVPTVNFNRFLLIPRIIETLGSSSVLKKRYIRNTNKWLNHFHLYSPIRWRKILSTNGFEVFKMVSYLTKNTVSIWDLFHQLFLNHQALAKTFSGKTIWIFLRLFMSELVDHKIINEKMEKRDMENGGYAGLFIVAEKSENFIELLD